MTGMSLAKYKSLAKGFRTGGKNCKRIMVNRVDKALEHAYVGRKQKKRDSRKLWIQQLNAGVREYGYSYSTFIHAESLANIELNRKVLAELAISEPLSFRAIVEVCKTVQPTKPGGINLY